MENNLPQKYKNNLFEKIKSFFIRLFKLTERKEKIVNSTLAENNNLTSKNIVDTMKNESTNNTKREELLFQIEKNPSLIDKWPIEKLLKLDSIYEEKIKEYDNEIKKLKKYIA